MRAALIAGAGDICRAAVVAGGTQVQSSGHVGEGERGLAPQSTADDLEDLEEQESPRVPSSSCDRLAVTQDNDVEVLYNHMS